ncbi:MAG TPA: carboxypeptidase regulatory-like domain-containing protein [Bryobacteraceae bacterium]|nr:carboxypeptidase regulatory-like domain-containing protein [Bryobacteraceae bacterium]
MKILSFRFLRLALIAVFCMCNAIDPVAAQTLYGTVVGLVEDASGAAVPNVKLAITNKGTGLTLEATTDSNGSFTILNVPAGTYDAKAGLTGFKTQSRTDLAVTVNTVSRVNFVMEVGSLSEQITVSAEVTQLQTDKADTHTEIRADLVKNLPLPGYRNYQSLINLVPGATPASYQNAVTDTPARSLRTNVNGTNASTNVTRIDGAASVNVWLPHHAGYVMPAEMVETVNVVTTAGDAEQGMAGGAAVTLVTKSGTNTLHGSAFWYHDNQHLRARNFFFTPTTVKPVSIYNNFGGTIGGPIVKNKLFYFYSYDNTKQRSGAFGRYSVPTADIRAGDFSATGTDIYDPLTGNTLTGTGRTKFPGNIIPANRISPIAQKIQSFYPAPNIAGPLNNFAIGATPQFNRDYNDAKITYQRQANHMIWGRYGIMNALVGGVGVFGDGVGPSPGADPGFGDTRIQNTSAGHNYTLSPNLLLDGVLGYQRLDQTVRGQDFGKDFSTVLGIPGLGGPDPRQQGFPNINVNGYAGFGVPGWMPLQRIEESYTTTHTLRWIKGKHNFAFGFDGVLHKLTHWSPHLGYGPRGTFNFNGGVTSNGSFNNYNAYAAFLLGMPNLIQKSIQHVMLTGREYQFGWYAQDRWQMTRKLTVSAGLRYEYYPLIGRSNGKGIERLDPETNLVYLGGRGNVPRANGFSVSKKLFAPRLGLAYRFDDKTVIRTGYGMNYSPLPWSRPLQGMYPLTVSFNFPAANDNVSYGSLATGVPPVVGPDLSSGVVELPAFADMRSPYPGQITRGYIQSWNFTLERRLPGSVVASAAYVGTQATHQSADLDINSGQVLGAGNAGRPYSARFGRNIATNMWNGFLSSNYHALQTSVRRTAQGLTLQGAYTWSKAINMTDDEGWAGVTYNWGPAFYRNRATAGYDRTHVFQMAYVYELPMGEGKKIASSGPMKQVAGGWSVSGITAAFTGTPFTPSAPGGTLNLPGNAQTPDQVKAVVGRPEGIGSDKTFYDTSAFAAIAPGQAPRFGSMGRNSLRNPGSLRHDLVLSKDFRFLERVMMTFRAEAYNFTNSRLSTGFASNDVTNPNFLRVLSASDERQIRFGLRFGF